jgi:hypothetical protein
VLISLGISATRKMAMVEDVSDDESPYQVLYIRSNWVIAHNLSLNLNYAIGNPSLTLPPYPTTMLHPWSPNDRIRTSTDETTLSTADEIFDTILITVPFVFLYLLLDM